MQCNRHSSISSARRIAALCAVLALAAGGSAWPAKAAPFAYVTGSNFADFTGNVAVIDTATNSVVATVTVPDNPVAAAVAPDGTRVYVASEYGTNVITAIDTHTNTVAATITMPGDSNVGGLAITPDGRHAYATHFGIGTVSVIDTAASTVTASITVGNSPRAVAIAPDGKHAYVTRDLQPLQNQGAVLVIDTATNTVVATVPVTGFSEALAVTPDGKYLYVGDFDPSLISVIDTATNRVVATVPVKGNGLAVTPDGKHVYATDEFSTNASVIDTATNRVVATIALPYPLAVAATPDGKHAYVANNGLNTVSVVDTATNAVVGTIALPVTQSQSYAVAIMPQGAPFLSLNAVLNMAFGSAPLPALGFGSDFTLSSTAPAFNPEIQSVTLQAGTFAVTIPPGSFTSYAPGAWYFEGVIGGVDLRAFIVPAGTLRYKFYEAAWNAPALTGITNPVPVTLTIGGDTGTTSVNAYIVNGPAAAAHRR